MNQPAASSSMTFLPLASGFLVVFLATPQLHAQCPSPPTTYPNGVIEGPVSCIGDQSTHSTVGINDQDEFIVSFERPFANKSQVWALRFAIDGVPIGTTAPISDTAFDDDEHRFPSLAMSRSGRVRVGWLGFRPGFPQQPPWTLLLSDFDFGAFMPTPTPPPATALGDNGHSVGTSDVGVAGQTFSNVLADPPRMGLVYQVGTSAVTQLRTCNAFGGGDVCFDRETAFTPTAWQPVLCQRSDGVMAIAWADAEDPLFEDSFFDIKLRLVDSTGAPIGGVGTLGEVLVNDPATEPLVSTQQSPGLAFDDAGNIVCIWTAPSLSGCPGGRHIFARRFQWNGDPAATPVAVSVPFQVDSATEVRPVSGTIANPTVALSLDNTGRWIAAWNAKNRFTVPREIRGQFFAADGRPIGAEFRVNQDISETTPQGVNVRQMANSAVHTLAYGPTQVVATWGAFGSFDAPLDVHFTLLPADFPQQQEDLSPCVKGDVDRNGIVDGLDIQPFVDLMLGIDLACLNIVDICPADIDNNAAVAIEDVPGFVCLLLGVSCGQSGQRGGAGNTDCNANGVPDATDILLGTSNDCNANFIPDECDVDPADPDGDGLTSNDLNANGIPDECEPDCNSNGIPDDKDIADATSADLNANGIPDECDPDCNGNGIPDEMDIDPADPDGNGQVSPDCNGNGEPDECEPDCNSNGVPDDCDIDPTDPDGDGQVSPDCNGNGWPDACDMALSPPFGSLDCNANGIPDECDIASGTSQDCNANGFPDECDIATGISQDANTNGIPDECEAQQSQGGGGSSPAPAAGTSTLSESETERAYAEFHNWCMRRQWGANAPRSCSRQFQAMVDKLRELGLPLEAR